MFGSDDGVSGSVVGLSTPAIAIVIGVGSTCTSVGLEVAVGSNVNGGTEDADRGVFCDVELVADVTGLMTCSFCL